MALFASGCSGFVEFAKALGEAQKAADSVNPGYVNTPTQVCSPAPGQPTGTLVCR